MKKLIIVLLGNCLFFSFAEAQFTRHIVRFTDKAGTPFTISNPSTYLSARAIARRTRYNIAIDSTDLPITPRYLDSLRSVPNVTILNKSKWLNQVAILITDQAALTKINSFPFVHSISPIAPRLMQVTPVHEKFSNETIDPALPPGNQLNYLVTQRNQNIQLNYGQTFNQIHIHNGEFLHDRGFQGEGMIISVLDGGFLTYKTNPAFDSIRINNQILGEWNFVNNTQNADASSGHGMNCLSTIAANRPGIMVGTAPHAKFWLFITEDVSSEYPIEEQNWAAAAEHSDSTGADIISSSLGYQDFDNPVFNHLYPDRNGNVAISTRAADYAAKKGMIVTNSAGNYGDLADQRKFISCPADGDSVVAVGAVTNAGTIASFSSWGPNSAGKIKPNIVSVGQGTIVANSAGNPVPSNGTSFSNPNIAGLITCLWGAFPEFSNMKIIDAVQRSSHKFSNPDERFGFGIPDMRKAFYILKGERSQQQFAGEGWFRATPNPFTDRIDAAFIADDSGTVKLYFKNIEGIKIDSAGFSVDSLDFRSHSFINLDPLPAGFYYVQYKSNTKDTTITLLKGEDLFTTDWIKVFPNPFTNQLNVYFKALVTGTASIILFDSKGRLMSSGKSIAIQQDNIYYTDFPVAGKLNRGLYIIHFNDGTNKRSIKIFRN